MSSHVPHDGSESEHSNEAARGAEIFDEWQANPIAQARARAANARARAEVPGPADPARLKSKQTLQTALSTALARFTGAELEPPVPVDPAAERQRRAAVIEHPQPGKVLRGDLCKTLNENHETSVAKHIDQCRQLIEDEDRELAPNRRERPVSKDDISRTKIHREARIMVKAIVNSRGAHVIQSYLRRLRPIFSGQPLAALRNAALCPQPQGGFRWTYADDCARRRIAIGLMWLVIGKWTNQRTAFGSRSSRRGLLVAGISVDRMLRAATPVGRRPYERHVFGSRTVAGWLGDMAHFERAGFAIRKRLPASRCNSWEVGSSGQPKNRYWVGCVVSQRTRPSAAQKRHHSMMAQLGSLANAVVLDGAAHEIGWRWAEENVRYAPPPSAAPS